jgi:hypothetical protein
MSRSVHSTGTCMRVTRGPRNSSKSGNAANSPLLIKPLMMNSSKTDMLRTITSTPQLTTKINSEGKRLIRVMTSNLGAHLVRSLISRTKSNKIRVIKALTLMESIMLLSTTRNSWPSLRAATSEER